MKTEKARRMPIYRKMRSRFPRTFGIVEDIKRNDHRNFARKLQNATARIINDALVELQCLDIPAIPRTDSIIVPAQSKHLACEIIGRRMFELTGVRGNVGNVHYDPDPPS